MNVEDLISHTYSNPTHRCSWIKDDKGKISLICGIFFCRERLFINSLIYVFDVSNFPLKIEFEINISIYIQHHQFSILTQIMIACCHKHKYIKQLLTLNTSDMMCIINPYIQVFWGHLRSLEHSDLHWPPGPQNSTLRTGQSGVYKWYCLVNKYFQYSY